MKMIVKMVFGSHMYGLNTPDSDMDYKGIFLPELDELLLGTAPRNINQSTGDDKSRNTKDDVDVELFSLAEFIKLACAGETVALDMLHVNPDMVKVEVDPEYGYIWEELVARRDEFYSTDLKAYMGYVKKQAAKYGLKGSRIAAMRDVIHFLREYYPDRILAEVWDELPINDFCKKVEDKHGQQFYEINMKRYMDTNKIDYVIGRLEKALAGYGERALQAEKNEGVDWKAISHALRAGYQMRDIFNEGGFSYPLKETEFLRQVKAGELDYLTKVSPVLEALVEEIDEIVGTVKGMGFRAKADVNRWQKWLVSTYARELIIPRFS